jgi:hypothetical protein
MGESGKEVRLVNKDKLFQDKTYAGMGNFNFAKRIRYFLFFFCLNLPISALRLEAQSGNKDIGWPRQVADNNWTLTYYQPQIDQWDNYKTLTAPMAFSLVPRPSVESAFSRYGENGLGSCIFQG